MSINMILLNTYFSCNSLAVYGFFSLRVRNFKCSDCSRWAIFHEDIITKKYIYVLRGRRNEAFSWTIMVAIIFAHGIAKICLQQEQA